MPRLYSATLPLLALDVFPPLDAAKFLHTGPLTAGGSSVFGHCAANANALPNKSYWTHDILWPIFVFFLPPQV